MKPTALLRIVATLIEGITPAVQATPDDTFEAIWGEDSNSRGGRPVAIDADGSTPIVASYHGCTTHEITITVSAGYALSSDGYQRAWDDSAAIAETLRYLADESNDIYEIHLDAGSVAPDGTGSLQAVRTGRILYSYG